MTTNYLADIEDLGATEEKDVLGGKKFTVASGMYDAVIDAAYFTESTSSKAKAINIVLHIPVEGKDEPMEIRDQIWYMNGQGSIRSKDGKGYGYNFIKADTLALLTTNKPLKDQNVKNTFVELWDSEAKKRLPQEKASLTDMIGKSVKVAVKEIRTNKTSYNKATKVETVLADERVFNEVDKYFYKDGRTSTEIRSNAPATFIEEWKNKWEGKLDDKFDATVQATDGTSGAPAGATPSLF